jgi:hypothetical protein
MFQVIMSHAAILLDATAGNRSAENGLYGSISAVEYM